MAATGFSYVKLEKNPQGFTEALGGAIYEWILIFFLFVNGLFSFLITKFARYCNLQPPCVICSRLDRVFSNDKLGSYWDMICGNHKKEISSLVTCHAHNKLVNVQEMCENCLFSFATINKSNAETYRLLVGKLGEDSGSRLYEEPYSGDHKAASSCTRRCVCCHEPWNLKAYAQKLAMTKPTRPDVHNLDLRLPRVIVLGQNSLDVRDRESHRSNRRVDPLSHVGYTELKITSDTESDLPASDDDETVSQGSKSAALLGDSIVDYAQMEAPFPDYMTSSNPINPSLVSPHSEKGSNAHLDDYITSSSPIDPSLVSPHSGKGSNAQLDDYITSSSPIDPSLVSPHSGKGSNAQLDDYITSSSPIDPSLVSPHSGKGSNAQLDDYITSSSPIDPSLVSPHSGKGSNAQLDDYITSSIPIDPSLVSPHSGKGSNAQLDDYITSSSPIDPSLVSPHSGKGSNAQLDDYITSSSPIDPSLVSLHSGKGSNSQLDDVKSQGSTSKASHDEHDLEESNNNESNAPDINVVSSSQEELISFDNVPLAANGAASPSNIILESGVTKNDETGETIAMESDNFFKPESYPAASMEKSVKTNGSSIESSNQAPNTLELGDAYKLAVGSRAKLTDVLTEQWLSKDSSRLSEDLKNLFSQFSAPRGFEQSPRDLSPKQSLESDDLKNSEASNSGGLHILQKRISLERNESGLSMDGSVVSEIEGESLVDRLKRQIEHDRKSMSTLYKELEEERNASAIAANQAMAMITRLQEEKATLHMEALQYLRMMEEQAEYDMEALQKSNDLISEKDKEIQDLEAELEFYRNNFSNDIENFGSLLSRMRNSPCKPKHTDMQHDEMSSGAMQDLGMDIEVERLQILQCLKNLEEKLGLLSSSEMDGKSANGEHLAKEDSEVHIDMELDCNQGAVEVSASSLQNDASPTDDSPSSTGQRREDASLENSPSTSRTNIDTDNAGKKPSEGSNLASLRSEVAYLHEKLSALDADRKFLARAASLVRSGDEGLKFIQDIANQLRELRHSRMRKLETLPDDLASTRPGRC